MNTDEIKTTPIDMDIIPVKKFAKLHLRYKSNKGVAPLTIRVVLI